VTLSIMTPSKMAEHCFAECHLCWVSRVSYADCHLCWVSLMLSFTYAGCHI